jgi:hypothetical protein
VVRAAGWNAGDPGLIPGRDGLYTFGYIPQRFESASVEVLRCIKPLIYLLFSLPLRWRCIFRSWLGVWSLSVGNRTPAWVAMHFRSWLGAPSKHCEMFLFSSYHSLWWAFFLGTCVLLNDDRFCDFLWHSNAVHTGLERHQRVVKCFTPFISQSLVGLLS